MWSKVKKQFESLLAESFGGPMHVHVTEYTRTNRLDVGRGWITLDGTELVSVQIPSFYSNNISFRTDTLDFGAALRKYLLLSITDARASQDELISAFAFLDRRLGKRTSEATNVSELHEFSKILYRVRCKAEGIER